MSLWQQFMVISLMSFFGGMLSRWTWAYMPIAIATGLLMLKWSSGS